MADTGWIRWGSVTDPQQDRWDDGKTNLINNGTGECTNVGTQANNQLLLTNINSLNIPEGAKITGIAYKFRAKKLSGTPDLDVSLGYDNSFNQSSTTFSPTLTDDYVDYEQGGDGSVLGLKNALIQEGEDNESLLGVESLKLRFFINNATRISLEGTIDSPALKIFYEAPPEGTQVSDWTRFTTLDNSNGFSNSSNLVSPNEGAATWNNPSSLYFIGSGFDFGIPTNATITGIEYRVVISPQTAGSLTSMQIWKGKLSTTSFGESDITDNFFTFTTFPSFNFYTGNVNNVRQIGKFDDTFGLTLTGATVNDLKLGFKADPIGGATPFPFGQITTEIGDGTSIFFPTPALRVFYTIPPPPKAKNTTNKVVIAPEIKGPFQTSKLNRLTSGLSLQGGDTNPAPEAATKIKVDPLLLDKFNKEGGIPNSPTTAPNSVADTRNAQKRANASTLNKPRLNPVDRDSETGLTNTDEAPLFTRRRFDPL